MSFEHDRWPLGHRIEGMDECPRANDLGHRPEVWAVAPFPFDNYAVSTCGRAIKVDGFKVGVPRLLEPRRQAGTSTYQLYMSDGSGRRWPTVGSLVLRTHDRLHAPDEECDHKDRNPDNNHLANLRWMTHAENVGRIQGSNHNAVSSVTVSLLRHLKDEGWSFSRIQNVLEGDASTADLARLSGSAIHRYTTGAQEPGRTLPKGIDRLRVWRLASAIAKDGRAVEEVIQDHLPPGETWDGEPELVTIRVRLRDGSNLVVVGTTDEFCQCARAKRWAVAHIDILRVIVSSCGDVVRVDQKGKAHLVRRLVRPKVRPEVVIQDGPRRVTISRARLVGLAFFGFPELGESIRHAPGSDPSDPHLDVLVGWGDAVTQARDEDDRRARGDERSNAFRPSESQREDVQNRYEEGQSIESAASDAGVPASAARRSLADRDGNLPDRVGWCPWSAGHHFTFPSRRGSAPALCDEHNVEAGNALRARRVQAGLSQKEVAAEASIQQGHLSQYENSLRGLSPEQHKRILAAIDRLSGSR